MLRIAFHSTRSSHSIRHCFRWIKIRSCHNTIGHSPLFGNVFSEYPNDVSFYIRAGVEQIGCNLLDCVAVRQELRLPGRRLAASFTSKSVHGGFADPTFDGFIPVQHKKRKCQSFAVMSDNFVTCQRHRNYPLNFDIQC